MLPTLDFHNSSLHQYIISIYYSSILLVHIGYGDVAPTQTSEMFLNIIIMIIGVFVYSFLIGEIAATIQSDDTRLSAYTQRLKKMRNFFDVYEIQDSTRHYVCL